MNKAALATIIAKVDDLPTLPRTVLKITELVNNPKSSARDLANVIADDQVLTARLLRLVNSSFYGFPQRISTVTSAVVLLGFDAIRNLLLTTSMFDLFNKRDEKGNLLQDQLWDHSLGCAVGAKIIGDVMRYDKLEEFFVAGLLHDIGKIVEVLFFPTEYEKVASLVNEEGILMVDAEEKVLDYTHAEIGHLLARSWNLPAKLVAAIAHHHRPRIAGQFTLEASVVHLADILCRALEIGSGGDRRIPVLDKTAWEALGFAKDQINGIMNCIEKEFSNIKTSMTRPE